MSPCVDCKNCSCGIKASLEFVKKPEEIRQSTLSALRAVRAVIEGRKNPTFLQSTPCTLSRHSYNYSVLSPRSRLSVSQESNKHKLLYSTLPRCANCFFFLCSSKMDQIKITTTVNRRQNSFTMWGMLARYNNSSAQDGRIVKRKQQLGIGRDKKQTNKQTNKQKHKT